MDALYNWHILRFYNSKNYQRTFARRLWQHRWSLWHLLKNLLRVYQANRYFNANQAKLEKIKQDFPKHPRQPTNLVPLLGEELYADKVSTVKVSLPISVQKKAADVPLQSAEMADE
jgi:magnesium-protoporphyrin IX monomethyl ester (oxidative) cyclase